MNYLLPNKRAHWLPNKSVGFVAVCIFAVALSCAGWAGESAANGSLRPVSAKAPVSGNADAPLIELDGSISISPDGSELSYRWEQIAGPKVELSSYTTAKPQFRTSTPGVYEFQLIVSANGLDSDPHIVRLEIERENAPPVAKILREAWGQVGKMMEVDGGESFDPEGEELTYLWRPITPGLVIPAEALLKPVLAFEPNLDGIFVIELVVSDGEKTSEPARCTLSIKPRPRPPVAQARIITVAIPAGATAAPVAELAAMAPPKTGEHGAVPGIEPLPELRTHPEDRVSADMPALTASPPPIAPLTPIATPLTASVAPVSSALNPLATPSAPPGNAAREALSPVVELSPVSDLVPMAAPDSSSWIPSGTSSSLPVPAGSPAPVSVPVAAPAAPLPPSVLEPVVPAPPQMPAMPAAVLAPQPVARIAAPQSGETGRVVMLDARSSYSPSGNRLEYYWRQTAGPYISDREIVFDGAAERFVPVLPGEYEFELVVRDGGVASEPVSHRVRVDKEPDPPVAVVVAPTHALPGSLVKMDATQSRDAQGSPLVYRWRQTGGPKVTNYVIDERLGDAAPAFRPDVAGLYSFSLSVFNGTTSSKPIDIDIEVTEAARRPPGLSIGGPDRAKVGERLVLNAVATDAVGWNLIYEWRQVEGPAQALSPSGGIRAMVVPPAAGRYVFALTARDDAGREVASASRVLEVPGGRTGGGAPYVSPPSPVSGRSEVGPRRVPELSPLPNSQQTPMTFPQPQTRGSGRGAAEVLRGAKR